MAVVFDAASAAQNIGQASSISALHSASGTNRAVLASVHQKNGATPSGVTYGGVAMTLLQTVTRESSEYSLRIYGLVAPATGSQLVAAAFPGDADWIGLQVVSANGVDQSTPFGTVVIDNTFSDEVTLNVPSAAGDLVFAALEVNWEGVDPAVGTTIPEGSVQWFDWGDSQNACLLATGLATSTPIGASSEDGGIGIIGGLAFKAAAGGGDPGGDESALAKIVQQMALAAVVAREMKTRRNFLMGLGAIATRGVLK